MGYYLKLMAAIVAPILSLVGVGKIDTTTAKPVEPGLRALDWWQNTIIYEVLVPSFQDSDGDGLGDIKGITSKLSHLVDIGVETIWLSPIFESPMVDFGYDISDYYTINDEFGTMADFEELLEEAHKLELKILLDFIPNHASTESEYFKRSVAREDGYEDFFVWADAKEDPTNSSNRLPPSNWDSRFTGSAWEWNENRRQYYLHQFTVSQADFNMRSPVVRKELLNIMTYWLEKGVDGFRVDAVNFMFEANPADYGGEYPDEVIPSGIAIDSEAINIYKVHTRDLLENYGPIYEWREFLDNWNKEHTDSPRIMVTEAYGNTSRTMMYYGGDGDAPLGSYIPLNFDLITYISEDSNARDFVYLIERWLTYMPKGYVANWQLGNHDRRRVGSIFGAEKVDGLNLLIMMLPGVAVTYQGEEIGMRNVTVTAKQTQDTRAIQMGDLKYSRDPFRTPFQWDDTTSAGFSTNTNTWLPLAEDYKTKNLIAQKKASHSHYKVYKAATGLRQLPALSHGSTYVNALTKNIIFLVRYMKGYDSYALLFNVGSADEEVDLTADILLREPMIVTVTSIHSSRSLGDAIPLGPVTLEPGEALVLCLPK